MDFAYLPTEKPRGTITLISELTVLSQEPSVGPADLFSSEVEPRALPKTGKTPPLNSIHPYPSHTFQVKNGVSVKLWP